MELNLLALQSPPPAHVTLLMLFIGACVLLVACKLLDILGR